MQVILITVITAVALISVMRGLDGGVKVLSEINMGIAALLLLFVLIAGPTVAIFSDFFSGLGAYATNLVGLSNPIGREDTGYMQGWTAFYWAWWISWSPFVGMFIARVSRGRTVREFIICVLIVPSLVCVLWMAVFGGVAIDQVLSAPDTSAVKAQVIDSYNPPISLFAMLEGLPFAAITSTIGNRAGNRVLRDLIGFRFAGHRHDHGRRQGRRTSAAAGSSGARSRARLPSYF